MNMMRWDPFKELESFSTRLNQMLGQPVESGRREDGVFADWSPALDIEERDQEYLVKTDLPDVKKEQVKVGIENGVLTIEGERKYEKDETTKRVHRLEREYGKFVRRLAMPGEVDQPKVAAEFKDGVLTVHLPKSSTARPRQVDVKVA
jgi:HSP20 family protein